ncbi:MAG TPA: hypothetical protein VFX51_07595 [Solirubrobacteraceae bacterium]|nr:hypothetical protein [Solirubrobacteraceae bacterium]
MLTRAVLIVVLHAGVVAVPSADAARRGFRDEDYLRFADRVVLGLDGLWDPSVAYYRSGAPNFDSQLNAALLVVHATAAARNWRGPSRNDDRARTIALRLTQSPPYWTRPRPSTADSMFHRPGWVGNMTGGYGVMHAMIDASIAEGLQFAYRSRAELGLPDPTARAIAGSIHAVASGSFSRYPRVRLNQINWPLELQFYDQIVTRAGRLAVEYRKQVRRFLREVRAGRNLGPSYRFLRGPGRQASAPSNLDSPEYADMVLDFLGSYHEARRAGMGPLPSADVRLLRAWVRRALFGYWTHSGLLSWDTGMGFRRWMKGKYWAYAHKGLMAVAVATRFRTPAEGAWAKQLFDRGLVTFDRLGGVAGLPHSALFGIQGGEQRPSDDRIFAARMAANAARAVWAGLGGKNSSEPPPFYAFDADIGRLAVSTPAYATAIVAVDRGVLPYGGIELARLSSARGSPLSNLGGRGAAAFGVVIRNQTGRSIMQSQTGLDHDPRQPVLVLSRSPQGRVDRVTRFPREPSAGPFRVLEAVGRRSDRRFEIITRHRFTRTAVEERWRVRRLRGRRGVAVAIRFPSWDPSTTIDAELRDGRVIPLTVSASPASLSVGSVRRFQLRGAQGGYAVTLLGRPAGSARAVRVTGQDAVPRPGPTLEVSLDGHLRTRPIALRVRITVQDRGDMPRTEVSARYPRPTWLRQIRASRAADTRDVFRGSRERESSDFAATSHAGGGTRTPDTRIMIPRRFGSTEPFAGAGGHTRGHIRACGHSDGDGCSAAGCPLSGRFLVRRNRSRGSRPRRATSTAARSGRDLGGRCTPRMRFGLRTPSRSRIGSRSSG